MIVEAFEEVVPVVLDIVDRLRSSAAIEDMIYGLQITLLSTGRMD